MKRTLLAFAEMILLVPTAFAAPANEMRPIRQFIDGFNHGDTKSAFAAYAAKDILIIDEFAPHRMDRSECGSRLGSGLRQTRTFDRRLRWIGELRRAHPNRDRRQFRLRDRSDRLQLQAGRQADHRRRTDDVCAPGRKWRVEDQRLDVVKGQAATGQ